MLEKINKNIGIITILLIFFAGCFFVFHTINSYIYKIEVEGICEKEISKHSSTCKFILTTKNSTNKSILAENSKVVQAFIEILNKNGISDEQILNAKKNGTEKEIKNTIVIKSTDIKNLKAIEVAIFKNPVFENSYLTIEYEVDNKEQIISDMIKEASIDANNKAKEQVKIFNKSTVDLQSSKTSIDFNNNSNKITAKVKATFRI